MELDDDEAMLVYEVAPEYEGRSWLLVITSEDVEVRALQDSRTLGDAVAVFEGLLKTDDPLAARAASDLHELILDDVLDEMGGRLRTVFLIPDGPLHELPFAALREEEASEPLGARVRIDVVPSASLWLRWRTTPPADTRGGVLALADPEISLTGTVDAFRGAEPWSEGRRSAALPRARGEARVVARSVGGDSRVLVGAEASEGALKTSDPQHYRVLHFAAHAVVDDSRPERSAVLLARGPDGEDGLLEVSEIAAMNLEDQIVILSACRGASGLRVEGEGILGLARAFLAAGARTVLANRWPYRDDHAAALTAAIAREIGRGKSIGDALTLARRAQVVAGAPAGAWAGVTLIGDGGVTPVPGGHWRRDWIIPSGLFALAALLAGLAWRDARRRVR
jgi:CHAT domain-containing protein